MEISNYFDKTKALNFIMEEAKRQNIPITKLCEGIVDQSNFTKMVKGNSNRKIRFEVLVAIAHRLKITDRALMRNCLVGDASLLLETEALYVLYEKSHFKELELKLNEYKEKHNYEKNIVLKQHELWLSGVVKAMNYYDYDGALKIFDEALSLSIECFEIPLNKVCLNETELLLYNSYLFVLGSYKGECELVLNEYERLLEYLSYKTYPPYLEVRIYYNYALLLISNKIYDKAEVLINDGIKFCIENSELILLPYYYYLLFYANKKIGKSCEAEIAYQKALFLMEIYEVPQKTITIVKETKEQLDVEQLIMDNIKKENIYGKSIRNV